MSRIALVFTFILALIGPASAQKAEVEAANAKWIESFNKADFAGIASFYTADAIALSPGSAVVGGREAMGAMWEKHGRTSWRSETHNSGRQAARHLRGTRDRDLQPED